MEALHLLTMLLLLLLLHFTASAAVSGAVLYVSPSPSPGPAGQGTHCPPSKPCHTLSEYAHNTDKYITDSTTFVFLPGTHALDTDFRVSNISSLVLLGDSSSLPELSSTVVCNNSAAMVAITGVSQLFISALEVNACGQTVSDSMRVEIVENFTLSSFHLENSASLNIFNSTALVEDTIFAYGTGKYCDKMELVNSRISFGGAVLIENVSGNCDGGFLGVSYGSTLTLLHNSILRLTKNRGTPGKRGVLYIANTTLNLMSNASLQSIGNTGSLRLNRSAINLMPNASMEFVGNKGYLYGSAALKDSTLNLMSNASMLFTENSIVLSGGALILINSVLNASSHTSVMFRRNRAGGSGGAMAILQSQIYFSSHTSMEFTGNTANVTGGALHVFDVTPSLYCFSNLVSELPILSKSTFNCFFQVPQNYSDIRLVFDNNKAPVGSDIYGGLIDVCKQHSGIYTDVFSDITCNSSRLGISSPPYQLCYCSTSTNDCVDGHSHNYVVYPGETVSILVLTKGQRQGPSPATLVAYPNSSTESVLNVATSSNECSTVNFTARGNALVSILYSFFVLNCAESRLITNVPTIEASVSLMECPPFFEMAAETCKCAGAIEEYTVNWDINNRSIARKDTTWIGYDAENGYAVHQHCPLDYCDKDTVYITSDDLDKQCVHNRAGLLCGECQTNYSLLLGTSHCGKCSNYNLFLLVFFGFAGIALVVLLLALRLTVAEGTINGLIFYANIFYLMKYQFLGTEVEQFVFLAWLNLDFGIKSCFYDGMNTYQNTWLQFLFPLYIWVLIGLVIFSSSYSSWMTRKLGTNPVAVLATLVLLSFNKIVYTITSVFEITRIKYTYVNSSEVRYKSVWLLDANPLMSSAFIPLFITSLLVFIFLVLPYALFLVFGQCLQARSYLKVFSWVNRPTIKCFLDNYHAPYQTRHRYWVGLMVLARLVLLIAFAFNVANDQTRYMAVIMLIVVCLLTWGWILGVSGVYKKRWVGILDASFILNLGIVTVVTAYCFSTKYHCGDGQAIVGNISLGVAFLTFIGILIYHVHLQFKDTAFGRKLSEKFCGICKRKKAEDDTETFVSDINAKLI